MTEPTPIPTPTPTTPAADEALAPATGIAPAAADIPTPYALKRPDLPEGIPWDEGFEKAAMPIAQGLGLTPHQVQGLMDFYASHQVQAFTAAGHLRQQDEARASEALRAEWGPDYTVKLSQAARAARYFGGEELVNLLNESGLGNNPQLIRAFERAGALLGEDTLKGSSPGARGALAPADAMRKARELMQKPGYLKRDHPEHFDLVAEVNAMFERAFSRAGS